MARLVRISPNALQYKASATTKDRIGLTKTEPYHTPPQPNAGAAPGNGERREFPLFATEAPARLAAVT